MTTLEVIIFVFLVSSPFIAYDFKIKFIEPVKRERLAIKRHCESEKHKQEIYYCGKNCTSPRYGIERQWWEKKTYEERLEKFNNPK